MGMRGRGRERSDGGVSAASFSVAALLIALAYSPVLHVPYGVMDDFTSIVGRSSLFVPLSIRGGRPIFGLLLRPMTMLLQPDVDDLWIYRGISLGMLILLAWLTTRWLARVGWTRWFSLAGGILVTCLLPMQVLVNWALEWPALVATNLSAAALLIATPARGDTSWHRLLGAVGLEMSALSIYQPAAMTYFGLLVAAVAVPVSQWQHRRRQVVGLTVTGIVAMVAYAPIVLLGQALSGAQSRGRALSMPDPFADAAWLVGVVLPKVAELWDAHALTLVSPIVFATVTVAAVSAIARSLRRRDVRPHGVRDAGEQALLLPILLTIAASPTLMVSERFPSFRSQTGLAVGLCMLFLAAVKHLLSRPRLRRALPATAFGLVAVALVSAAHNTLVYYAIPQTME